MGMQISNVTFGYKNKNNILDNISLKIEKGKITTIMGGNGCGKTTLLKLISRNLELKEGSILIDGENIKNYRLRDFAKKVSIVHQKNIVPDDLTVKQLVMYGRIPYTSFFKTNSKDGEEKVKWAMEVTGIHELSDSTIGCLSGGQRQRAFIAMALAQDTEILLLDEPTTFLDVKYQVEILRMIKELNENFQITIVMVLHDINQAITYSDNIIGLKNGKVLLNGAPEKIINHNSIQELYGINLEIISEGKNICVKVV